MCMFFPYSRGDTSLWGGFAQKHKEGSKRSSLALLLGFKKQPVRFQAYGTNSSFPLDGANTY